MVIETLQKATTDLISKVLKDSIHRDRRDYGLDIRLWNDRDPRVDQSFFQGSVPGFVLGADQKIVDWNIGFDLVFGHQPQIKRGSHVSDWYQLIENFRRLPNREEKLQGEAMLPITDRERVVFISPLYGRMVFMKIMSPVIDRHSGRIIGWNIALNVNSVHERVKFFTDLNDRIQQVSLHARYVVSIDQLAHKSKIFHQAVEHAVSKVSVTKEILLIGATGAVPFVEEIFNVNPSARVYILDEDNEALRHLRHKLAHFGKQVKLVRKSFGDLSIIPQDKFSTAIVLWPTLQQDMFANMLNVLKSRLAEDGQLAIISWLNKESGAKFWDSVQRDLEGRHEVDSIRWHIGVVKEEADRLRIIPVQDGNPIASGLGLALFTVKSA
jgi:hypothetical protein